MLNATFFGQNRHRAAGSGPPTANLLAWFKASSLSSSPVTTWPDSSGNGHNLTMTGSPTWAAGAINGLPAVTFNGSSQYGTMATPVPYSGQFSIYVVFSSPNSQISAFVSGTSNTFEYRLDATYQALFQNTALLASSSAGVASDVYYKAAVTYIGSTGALAFYQDGAAAGSFTDAQTITNGINVVGANASGGISEFYKGSLAEILIYGTGTYNAAVDTYLHGDYNL